MHSGMSTNRASEWGRKVILNVAWLSVPGGLVWAFWKLQIYWDFHTQTFLEWAEQEKIGKERQFFPWICLVDARSHRRIAREWPVPQITTNYNQGMQKMISQITRRQASKQTGYSSSRGPQRVPLLSAQNRKLRLQFAWPHQKWKTEDLTKRSDESLSVSDGRFRIWRKKKTTTWKHGSIPPCVNDSVWWWWRCSGVGAP